MNILLASSELYPFSKTGGLADMVSGLAGALAEAGHETRVVTPLYRGIREKYPALRPSDWSFQQPLDDRFYFGQLWELDLTPRLKIYFVDQPQFFDRAGIYGEHHVGYADNDERYLFFSKCVVNLARYLPWHPDVVHAHDWQTGFVPAMILQAKRAGWVKAPRTCFTIHNLAYQGLFPAQSFALTNLPAEFFSPQGVEFYGQVNFLKAGISFADVVTTVSQRYAREITTPEFGCGLDGFLRDHAAKLKGILNGADYREWNPQNDRHLFAKYSAKNLAGKGTNKLALQRQLALPANQKIPLFGSIGRLDQQKGVDILLAALEEMLGSEMQFCLLGSGAGEFENGCRELARRYPEKVAVNIGYNETLAHRIAAGSDFFLMPSQFEPCGLTQIYSLRYGTVPIVRATGGLDDSVIDYSQSETEANGIKFSEFSARALGKAVRKALAIYENPSLLNQFRQRGMKMDFSWQAPVKAYLSTYQD